MTDKHIPSPEEIQNEFKEFVQKRFGDNVQVVASPMEPPFPGAMPVDEIPDEKSEFDLNFDLKPKDVKKHLDRFVIKQEEAKKALSIAVCDHYNHVRQYHENPDLRDIEYSKQNVMVLGPTGVGKTYLIKQIAKLIGVPFVKADATRFSETGYVGANVDDLIRDLVSQANGDLELAQYGIIYLDEADKLAASRSVGGKDVSGRGVQIGLLKLMEETEVDLMTGGDMSSQLSAFMEFQQKGKISKKLINTRHILFIISGAFNGLIDIIKERENQNAIGFNTERKSLAQDEDFLHHATTKDYVDFGFEPEFVGRLPVRVACDTLDKDDLFKILKNSEGSIIKQYVNAFKAYDIDATFSDEALKTIAKKASKEKTGARALMTVTEKILRDYKFELPSTAITQLDINEEVVNSPKDALKNIIDKADSEFPEELRLQIRLYEKMFFDTEGMKITFDQRATRLICQKALEQEKQASDICEETLDSFKHGLNLIQNNTGKSEFLLNSEVILNPDAVLERWVKESYTEKSSEEEKPTETV